MRGRRQPVNLTLCMTQSSGACRAQDRNKILVLKHWHWWAPREGDEGRQGRHLAVTSLTSRLSAVLTSALRGISLCF